MISTRYAPGRAGPPGTSAAGPGPARGGAGRPGPGSGRTGSGRAGRLLASAVLPVADLLGVFAAAAIAGAGPARGAAYGVAGLIAAAAAGLSRRHIGQRVGDQAGRLAAVAVLPVLVLLPWTAAGQALLLAGCAAGLVVAARTAACAGLRAARRRGRLTGQALIIGSGPAAAQLARLLRAHPELGLNPCGRLDNQPARVAGLAVLGPLRAAPAVLDHFDIAQVLVCWPAATEAELTAALRACRASGARVSVLPRLPELGAAVPRACLDDIWGVPLIPLRPDPLGPARLASKRAIDLSAGAVLFALTAPLMAALALAVRLDLRLPPLFRQVRVVGRGRRATITKLRTLRPDGDPDTTWVVPEGQCSALGRLLRGTHADELPQLASVLRGDMSLVGPRPERPHFARQLAAGIPGYADREQVTAGLTGWAQVHGLTGDTSIEDRVRFDNSYIEYGSAWLDLLILARTVPSALSGALHCTRGGTS